MTRRDLVAWLSVTALVSTGALRAQEATMAEAASAATETVSNPLAVLADVKVVDLSHAYDAETIYWPTSPSRFELEVLAHGMTEAGFFYAANRFCTPEHGGTHLDAPIHFAEGRETAAEVPLSKLIVPAMVIDVRAQAEKNPDYVLTAEDLAAWEAEHGPVAEGSAVLLYTGWSDRWPDAKRYLGDDTPGDASKLHFPSFGPEAVNTLVGDRGVAVLGVDTASIDPGNSTSFPVHQIAGEANVSGLENLTGLGELPARGAWLFALPMKIGEGSGAPLRAVALVP